MSKCKDDVVIVSACRTPIGAFMGGLKDYGAVNLGAYVIKEAMERVGGLTALMVDEVIMGQVLPCGCGQNPARQAALIVGMVPWLSGALTINKVCGSGLMAVALAAQYIQTGFANVVVAGGMESMTNAPHYIPRSRKGMRLGQQTIEDHMVHDGLWDVMNDYHMGRVSDAVAKKWGVSRGEQDAYAAESYRRADYLFSGESISCLLQKDEIPRPTSIGVLSEMKSVFSDDGTTTAGNASKIADGAAAVVVTSREKAQGYKLPIMARIITCATAGIDPQYVLMAPIYSIPKALKRAGMEMGDIDLHEINEAFASSTVAVMRELQIDHDKLNVNGGAIALGHPIGASGARVLTTLLYEMQRSNKHVGQATLCLGGGEAITMIVEGE